MKLFDKRLQILMMLTLISVSLAGCGTSTGSWVKPINPTAADAVCISRVLKQQLVTHNETWEKEQ